MFVVAASGDIPQRDRESRIGRFMQWHDDDLQRDYHARLMHAMYFSRIAFRLRVSAEPAYGIGIERLRFLLVQNRRERPTDQRSGLVSQDILTDDVYRQNLPFSVKCEDSVGRGRHDGAVECFALRE